MPPDPQPQTIAPIESLQETTSLPINLVPEAPETPTNVVDVLPNEDQNQATISPESQNVKPEEMGVEAFTRRAERTEETPPSALVDNKSFLSSLLSKLKEKLSFRTEKRLSKIMELVRAKGASQAGSRQEITNDDVEKLLHVSDASAGRYLAKLVQRGDLRMVGSKKHAKYLLG